MMLTRTIPVTQQQIDTLQGILEGREFMWNGVRCKLAKARLYREDGTGWKKLLEDTSYFLSSLLRGVIHLVPTPPEPLSDAEGHFLWLFVQKGRAYLSDDHFDHLVKKGLLGKSDITHLGKYLLGEYLMRMNKEAANV